MKTIRIFGTRGLILAAVLGVSVGFTSPAFAQVFRSDQVIVNPDGKVTYLGTLGGNFIQATGINDSGQVVGYSNTTGNDSLHAFITGPNGKGMTDLGTLGGPYSHATGINDSGQVVGQSQSSDPPGHGFIPDHAFITGPNGMGMTDLGTLGGSNSYATGINDSGQVVGFSSTADGSSHAFITGPNGMGMTDLGTLGGTFSSANGINDSGQVVGESATADGTSHRFITGPNGMGMSDLNSLVDLPDEIYLLHATGINNLGQVIAIATIIPEPASYALMLAGLGLVGFMARRKRVSVLNRC